MNVLRPWLILLIAIIAIAFTASPVMGYISVKYTYDGIYDGQTTITLDQAGAFPGWWIFLQDPSQTIYIIDSGLPTDETRMTDQPLEVWTDYSSPLGTNPYSGYMEEPVTQFYAYPGYDPYVTIVPVIDKSWYLPK